MRITHVIKMASDQSIQKRCFKKVAPTNDFLEMNEIQQLLQARANMILETKVERLSGLLQGEWLPDLNLIVILKNVGKFFHHMGHTLNGQNMLYPEEALYLMDINCMEVYYNDLPISMQEAYDLFLQDDLALEKYQVYAHLSRLGYIVVRHQVRLEKDAAKTSGSSSSEITCLDDHKDVTLTSSKRSLENNEDDSWSPKKTKLSQCYTSSGNLSQPCLLVKYPDIHFPNVSGQDVIMLTCPNKRLLPPNVEISAEKCVVNLKALCSSRNTRPMVPVKTIRGHHDSASFSGQHVKRDLESPDRNFSSRNLHYDSRRSLGRSERFENNSRSNSSNVPSASQDFGDPHRMNINSNWRSHRQTRSDSDNIAKSQGDVKSSENASSTYTSMVQTYAQCWKDYKMEISSSLCLKNHYHPAIKILSTPRIQPLITKTDASSTSSILDMLTVIEQVRYDYFKTISYLEDILMFDVYLPNTDYIKTLPQQPNHCLIVKRIEDPILKIEWIAQTISRLGDQVGLKFAIVDNGDIAFYSFNDVVLPREISIG